MPDNHGQCPECGTSIWCGTGIQPDVWCYACVRPKHVYRLHPMYKTPVVVREMTRDEIDQHASEHPRMWIDLMRQVKAKHRWRLFRAPDDPDQDWDPLDDVDDEYGFGQLPF